jgi:hypothetical protein
MVRDQADSKISNEEKQSLPSSSSPDSYHIHLSDLSEEEFQQHLSRQSRYGRISSLNEAANICSRFQNPEASATQLLAVKLPGHDEHTYIEVPTFIELMRRYD